MKLKHHLVVFNLVLRIYLSDLGITTLKMRSHDLMHTEEASDAAWEAGKGALIGASKWGCVAAVLGGIGYAYSPVYRGTTIQFKM